MTDKIPKSVLLDFITSYEEDNEPPEPESPPEPPLEEPIPEEPVPEEPEQVIDCFVNDVSSNPDYMVSKLDFIDLVYRNNKYIEDNGNKPNILSLKENGVCTGNYITVETYEEMFGRWYQYIQIHGEEPAFVSVYKENPPEPAPGPNRNCPGELHSDMGAYWSLRKGYTTPLHQVDDSCCSVHSSMQVIYQLLGLDLREQDMVNWAYNNGNLNSNGASHQQLMNTLNHFSDNKFNLTWHNYSEFGMGGLKEIIENPCTSFITHTLLSNSYGHYQVILAVNEQYDQVYEQYSVGNAALRVLSGATYREWMSGISQQSILKIEVK
jgi:hypothetical protein